MIAAAVYAFFPYLTHRITSSAFVNAEISRVTAPINGKLSRALPNEGAYLQRPLDLSLIEAVAPDRRQLAHLEQQIGAAMEMIALHEAQLAEIARAENRLETRLTHYRDSLLLRLEQEIVAARADVTACEAEEADSRGVFDRTTTLARRGFASRQQLERARAQYFAATARCAAAAARVRRAEVEQTAARASIFLHDGANDSPYSQQQHDRLLLRRQEIELSLAQARARLDEADGEWEEERRRLSQTTEYKITLPAGHLVWSLAASPGSAVVEGQPVLDLADCARRFISAEMPESSLASIAVGDKASLRLIGTSAWVAGRVIAVVGSAAKRDERLLAADIPQPGPRKIRVDISLPLGGLPKGAERRCEIGRLAEVRLERFDIDFGSLFSAGVQRVVSLIQAERETI